MWMSGVSSRLSQPEVQAFSENTNNQHVDYDHANHSGVLSLMQLAAERNAGDMRDCKAPEIPDYIVKILEEDYHDTQQKNARDDAGVLPISEAFQELICQLYEATAHETFLSILKQQDDPKVAVAYMFKPRLDAEYRSVDLKLEGQNMPFHLYNYSEAPFALLLKEAAHKPEINVLLGNIKSYFENQGIKVSATKVRAPVQYTSASEPLKMLSPRDPQPVGVNPLRDTWGVYEDPNGHTMIGYFDKSGLLEGEGMVIHTHPQTQERRTLRGFNFEKGLLNGFGCYSDNSIRFYGEYKFGRANGLGLVTSKLSSGTSDTVNIGPVFGGQMQLITRLLQRDADQTGDNTNGAQSDAVDAQSNTFEIDDYVDGTQNLTAQFRHSHNAVSDISVQLGLPFIPKEYRSLNRKKSSANKVQLDVLALPGGSYIGTRQTKNGLRHDWTHLNGITRQEPFKQPKLVSSLLQRAVATLNEKDQAKKGIKK